MHERDIIPGFFLCAAQAGNVSVFFVIVREADLVSDLVRYGRYVIPRCTQVKDTVAIFGRINSHRARQSWSTNRCHVGDSSISRHWISLHEMHGVVRDEVFSRIGHPPLVDFAKATICARVPDFIWLGRRERYLLPEDDLESRRGQLHENQVYHIEHHYSAQWRSLQRALPLPCPFSS